MRLKRTTSARGPFLARERERARCKMCISRLDPIIVFMLKMKNVFEKNIVMLARKKKF